MSAPDECAACGKVADGLKKCTACKGMAKYCNVSCQKAHRPQHKRACKTRAVELHDEKLFKQPEMDDCDICFLPISVGVTEANYKSCCGKTVCHGCLYTDRKERERERRPVTCPFCRKLNPKTDKEALERINNRIEHKDADAFLYLGWMHHNGSRGLTRDRNRAFELWLKGAELGSAEGYNNISLAYFEGRGVPQDQKKAHHYMELAAIEGDAVSRHNLAAYELRERRNSVRGVKHLIIAARSGFDESLNTLRDLCRMGQATKDDYETALRAHKQTLDEITSEQRDEAAKASAAEGQTEYTPAVTYR